MILSSSTSCVFSQSISPNINRSYKVHVGDSARFTIVKAFLDNHNSYFFPFTAQNNSFYQVNLTHGDYFDLKVVKIDTSTLGSGSGPGSVYSDLTFVTPHNITNLQMINSQFFLQPAFDSQNDVNLYINQFGNGAVQNGDLLTSTTSINGTTGALSNTNSSEPLLLKFNNIINWKTGWLYNLHNIGTLANGSKYFEIFVQGHPTSDFLATLFGYTTSFIELGSLVIVIAMVVILGISYNSYLKKSKHSGNSQSFYQYFQHRFHYTKKKQKQLTGTEADKALQTIESILEEIKDQGK